MGPKKNEGMPFRPEYTNVKTKCMRKRKYFFFPILSDGVYKMMSLLHPT